MFFELTGGLVGLICLGAATKGLFGISSARQSLRAHSARTRDRHSAVEFPANCDGISTARCPPGSTRRGGYIDVRSCSAVFVGKCPPTRGFALVQGRQKFGDFYHFER